MTVSDKYFSNVEVNHSRPDDSKGDSGESEGNCCNSNETVSLDSRRKSSRHSETVNTTSKLQQKCSKSSSSESRRKSNRSEKMNTTSKVKEKCSQSGSSKSRSKSSPSSEKGKATLKLQGKFIQSKTQRGNVKYHTFDEALNLTGKDRQKMLCAMRQRRRRYEQGGKKEKEAIRYLFILIICLYSPTLFLHFSANDCHTQ